MCANKRFYASMITVIRREMTTDFALVLQSVCDFHYDCSFIIIHSFTPCSLKPLMVGQCMHKHMNGRGDAAHTKYTKSLCIVIQRYS